MDASLFRTENDEINVKRSQTSESILEAAKELVARKGPNGVTVRDITSASGANSAAVNYYFQSKDRLVSIATEQITSDVNRERLQLLNALQEEKDQLTIEDVLKALIEPILTTSRSVDGGSLYVRSVFQFRVDARAAYNSFDLNRHVAAKFIDAIQTIMPELSPIDVIWHYEYARGTAIHLLANLDPVSRRFENLELKEGEVLADEPKYQLDQEQVDKVISIIAKGFR